MGIAVDQLIKHIDKLISFEDLIEEQMEEFGDKTYKMRITFLKEAKTNIDKYLHSLERLIRLAEDNTGGSRVAGKFLVALYNVRYARLDPRDFIVLDQSYWNDVMNVLKLDRINFAEIHEYVDNGDEVFQNLAKVWKDD